MLAGALTIEMNADLARLVTDLRTATGHVNSFAQNVEVMMGRAKLALQSLGVTLSVGAFVGFIKHSIEAMAAMEELSQRTSVTVETLTALSTIAKQSGTNMDNVAGFVQKLEKSLLQFARDGAGKASDGFKTLGITQAEAALALKDMDKFLPEFAKKLTASGGSARELALAQELAGKGAGNLMPFLIKLAEQAQLHAKYTTEDAAAANRFTSSMVEMKEGSAKLGVTLANEMLPSLQKIVDAMNEAKKAGEGWLASLKAGIQTALTGDDLHKANVEFTKLTSRLLTLEKQLEDAQRYDTTGKQVASLEAAITKMRGNLNALQAFRDQLEAAGKLPDKPKRPEDDFVDEAALKRAREIAVTQAKLELDDKMNILAIWKTVTEEEYRSGIVDLEKYYAIRREINDVQLAVQISGVRNEIAAQAQIRDASKSTEQEKTGAVNAIMALEEKRTLAYRAQTLERTLLGLQETAALRAFQQSQIEGIVKSAQIQLDARDAAIDATGKLRVALSQEVKDREFDISQIGLEVSALGTLAISYDQQLQQTAALNIARETASRLRRLEIEEIAEIARLNALIPADGGILSPGVAAQIQQAIAIFDARRKAIPDEVISEQNKLTSIQRLRDIQGETQSLSRSINDGLTDAFMSAIDTAGDGFKDLGKSVEKMFRSMVLKPLIQAALAPVSGAISTTLAGLGLAGPASASASGGGMGIGNLLSTGNSLYSAASGNSPMVNAISSFFGAGVSSAGITGASMGAAGVSSGAFFGSLGSSVAEGVALGGEAFAASLSAPIATGVAEGLGAAGVFGGAAELGAAGAAGGAAAGIGAAIPYVGIALAAYALLSGSGIFGGSGHYAQGLGYRFSGDYSKGAGTDLSLQGITDVGEDQMPVGGHIPIFNAQLDKATAELVQMAKSFHLNTDVLDTFTAHFQFTTDKVGQAADDAAHIQVVAQIMGEFAQALIPNLKDLGTEGESLLQTFTRLGGEIAFTDKLLEILGTDSQTGFGAVGLASIELRDKLVKLMGGLSTASTLAQSYYENFFTTAERQAKDLEMVSDALAELGFTDIKTREQFRARVEAQDLATKSGQEMFAVLITLAPAFAAVTQSMDDAAAAALGLAGQITQAQSDALKAVTDQISASKSSASAAHQAADSYRQITASLVDAVRQLRGGDLSPLTNAQKLAEARANLTNTGALAATGDAAALNALPKLAQDFLAQSRAFNASSQAYTADFETVMKMLSEAGGASEAMVNWNEYQATLLETQTGILEAIKGQLELPNPDIEILAEQTALLGTIASLLEGQTVQIINGNVLTVDQTGHIIANTSIQDALRAISDAQLLAVLGTANTLNAIRVMSDAQLQLFFGQSESMAAIAGMTDAQLSALLTSASTLTQIRNLNTDQLTELFGVGLAQDLIKNLTATQTQQIITGNAVQDVIRNITALDTSYSAEMLRALVTGDSLQNAGISQTVALLQELVNLTGQRAAEEASVALARIAAQVAATEAAQAAAAAAAAAEAQAAITAAQDSAAAAARANQYEALNALFEEARYTPSQDALRQVFSRQGAQDFFAAHGATDSSLNDEFELLRAEVTRLRETLVASAKSNASVVEQQTAALVDAQEAAARDFANTVAAAAEARQQD